MDEGTSIKGNLVQFLTQRSQSLRDKGLDSLAIAYGRAANSLRRGESKSGDPLGPILSGKDAQKVKNIGPRIGKDVEKWLSDAGLGSGV